MADPHSPDANRAGASHLDPDRDAKIDELLLAGLEHYFAGRFQESINVWGRVLFLDRGHARARAYIERARSALAERQRQSEQLTHEGVAAMQRGDGGAARELLTSAVAHGDAPDLALAYLGRLETLDSAPAPDPLPRTSARADAAPPRGLAARRRLRRTPRPIRALPVVAVILAGIGIIVVAASFDLLKPLVERSWGRPAAPPRAVLAPEPLPVPRGADVALARARALSASGHLLDALAALESVSPADPAYAEAQRLCAEVQRSLLAAAGVAHAQRPATGQGPPE